MAHLLLCEQRSGHWVPLNLEQPLPLWAFQFATVSFSIYPTVFSPVPAHAIFTTQQCPKALRRAPKGRWVTQGSRIESACIRHLSWSVQIKKSIQCLKCKYYWLSDLPRSLWFLDRNHRCESEKHWPEILRIKALCVLNSGGQTFVPGGCLLLYDSLFWNEAFPPTLLPPSFTFRKVSACFYLFSLLFFSSQVFFGKAWHRFLESDSCSDPWRLSSIVC